MRSLRILGVAVLVILMIAPDLMAQRRGGLLRGGMRGAMVGGLLGGSSGARNLARVGAVAGGVRRANYRAVQRETQSRGQYQSTTVYKSTPHSNFSQSQPQVIIRHQ
jgi:uncharacterized protein YcfJ